MTFIEALDTGMRIQSAAWMYNSIGYWWYKKISEVTFIDTQGFTHSIKDHSSYLSTQSSDWFIYPDDEKLYNFNKNLEDILK